MNNRKSRYSIQLESFAMTDVVLNIFIFFVIVFTILYTFNPKRVKIDLPKASGDERVITPINISINENGTVYFRNEQIPLSKLESILKKEEASKKPVEIRGYKGLHFYDVNKVLTEALHAGVSKVNLAITEETVSNKKGKI